MASTSLTGRRGWTTVASLTAVLGVLVTVQLPSASAASVPAGTPVAALVGPSTGVLPVAGVTTLGGRTAAGSVSAPSRTGLADLGVLRAGTRLDLPSATAPARPAATRPAAARPATARPAAARPAAARPAAARPAAGLCSGAGWEQRRGQAALASLKGGAGKAGYRVSFEGARKGVLGLTYLDERRIALFVRSCASESTELLRHVMAHELGHAHDTAFMSTATRKAWMDVRGIAAGTPWYGCDGCSDFATPAGDFAEVYAQWARGASSNKSRLAGDVPPAQLASLAQRFFGA